MNWAYKPDNHEKEVSKIIRRADKKKRKKNKKRKGKYKYSNKDKFYSCEEWRKLRYRVLRKYSAKCMCCGRSPKEHGIVIHVDHILPRSKFPKLELSFDNLQLLCADCNIGKSNLDATDWRPDLSIDEKLDLDSLDNCPF